MLKKTIRGIAVLGAMFLAAPMFSAAEQPALKTQMDKMNYTTGVDIVRKLKQQGGEINLDLVIQGMKDELTGDNLLLSEAELQKIRTALQAGTQKQTQAAMSADESRTAVDSKTPAIDDGTMQKQDAPEQQTGQSFLAQGEPSVPTAMTNAGPAVPPSAGNQQTRADVLVPNQNGQSTSPSSMDIVKSMLQSGFEGTGQLQDGMQKPVEQGGRLASDGTVISKRNQAILRARELKAGMGASQ